MNRKLTIQLVPQTSWYNNLRSIVPNWSEIAYKVKQRGRCDICGYKTNELDAHEVWKYDDVKHLQELDTIVAVCKKCHLTIHIGYANTQGKTNEAVEHYMKVNNVTSEEAQDDIDNVFDIWCNRSKHKWDISYGQIYGVVENQFGISCNIDKPVDNKWYAKVAYEDKDVAKAMGARWDSNRKMWYFDSEHHRERWYSLNKR